MNFPPRLGGSSQRMQPSVGGNQIARPNCQQSHSFAEVIVGFGLRLFVVGVHFGDQNLVGTASAERLEILRRRLPYGREDGQQQVHRDDLEASE